MKRFLNILGIVLALSVIVTSCEKAPFLTLSTPKTINFSDQGGTQSITFAANRDWSVSSSDSWCRVSPSSGNKADGDISVTLTCEPNTTYDPRNATITVKVEELSEIITVTQDTNLGLIVSPTSYDLSNAAQTIEVEVRANVKYTLEIEATCKDWISQVGTKALATEKLAFSIAANESYDNREGKITIKQTDGNLSETIVVKQKQTDVILIPTSEYNLSNEAQTLSIEVQSNIQFEVSSATEWIHYVETKALSTSTIELSIDANESYYSRQGQITVIGREGNIQSIIRIYQEQTDALFITDDVKDYCIASKGGLITVNVFHNIDFEIDQSTKPEWISYSTSIIDDNNTQLLISVNKNSEYRGRTASLSINGKTLSDFFTVVQHQVDILYADASLFNFAWDGGPFSFTIYSNVEFSLEMPAWVSISNTSTTVDGDLKATKYMFLAEENLDIERTGDIVFSWDNEGVSSACDIPLMQDKWIIYLNSPGGLIDVITNERIRKMKALTVIGDLNGTDILYIRRMECLYYMNLSDARIVEGGVSYGYIGAETCVTTNDVIGHYMFQVTDTFTNLSEVILPANTIEVGFGAFWGQRNLKKITIPESVTIIDKNAFSSCSLESIVLPSHLEYIGWNCFYECHIKEIIIPDTVKHIGQSAFNSYGLIVHLKALPTTLTSIELQPFGDTKTAVIYVPKGTKEHYMLTSIGDYVNVYEE